MAVGLKCLKCGEMFKVFKPYPKLMICYGCGIWVPKKLASRKRARQKTILESGSVGWFESDNVAGISE